MKSFARVYHILESIQYGILYIVSAFIGGVGLDFLFPPYSKLKKTKEVLHEIVLQCISLIVVVYIIRYFIKQVPILFPVYPGSGYKPYTTHEFDGEMMMSLIFLSSQLNLIWKINLVSTRIYEQFYKEERLIEKKDSVI
jgi:hypothetical protein